MTKESNTSSKEPRMPVTIDKSQLRSDILALFEVHASEGKVEMDSLVFASIIMDLQPKLEELKINIDEDCITELMNTLRTKIEGDGKKDNICINELTDEFIKGLQSEGFVSFDDAN